MYVGDGPPRSTPHRSDGSVPTTLTREQVNLDTVPEEPVNIDDMVHVQSLEQINSIEVEADERAASNYEPSQGRFDLSFTPTSVPTCPYQAYWCRCRQIWLSSPHNCPEPPVPAFPTTMPIRPGTKLPADWVTHRIVVDPSIYPGGVVPEEMPAAAASSSALGGEHGCDLPARRFAPGPAGFDIGQTTEALQHEATDIETAYDNVVFSANAEGGSTTHCSRMTNTHPSNNALYPPAHGMYRSNLEGQLAASPSPYDNDPCSGSETEVPQNRSRRSKRTAHRGRADKNSAFAEKNDKIEVPASDGDHKVRGRAKEKQSEPNGKRKEGPTKEDSGAVSTVEKGERPEPRGMAKEVTLPRARVLRNHHQLDISMERKQNVFPQV